MRDSPTTSFPFQTWSVLVVAVFPLFLDETRSVQATVDGRKHQPHALDG